MAKRPAGTIVIDGQTFDLDNLNTDFGSIPREPHLTLPKGWGRMMTQDIFDGEEMPSLMQERTRRWWPVEPAQTSGTSGSEWTGFKQPVPLRANRQLLTYAMMREYLNSLAPKLPHLIARIYNKEITHGSPTTRFAEAALPEVRQTRRIFERHPLGERIVRPSLGAVPRRDRNRGPGRA